MVDDGDVSMSEAQRAEVEEVLGRALEWAKLEAVSPEEAIEIALKAQRFGVAASCNWEV